MEVYIKPPNVIVVEITGDKKKILQMRANNVSRGDIAEKMGLSKRTVEAHIDELRKAFGYKSESPLIAELMRRNIIK